MTPGPPGYRPRMDARNDDDIDRDDQDSEPTLKAPGEEGPTGITAPKAQEDAGEDDGDGGAAGPRSG
jgi:hypothetical protein